MSVISASGLAVAFGSTPVWADASLDVAPGEFVAVLGPNGAGKTTLFRVLLGLTPPSAGAVTVLGASPRRGNAQVGYVPQRRPIESGMRLAGTELVKLGLTGRRMARAARAAAVDVAVEAVGASSFAGRGLGTLSGGEVQRLGLAQAIVNEPRLLLLDEPLASLDVRAQAAVARLVGSLARSRDMAVLLIAHDVNPLLPFVDRVMYVARGRVTVGAPADVITGPRLSQLYDANVEVLRDSRGRVFVVGLDEEHAHPHPSEAS